MLGLETSKSNSEVSKSNSNILVRNNFFRKNNVTSEGAVSHNFVYYNISPLIANMSVSMLTIILSKYQ